MFSRLRAIGLWILESVISPAELEAIDENLSNALDGAGGGAYAPTAPLEIGGEGMVLSGPSGIPGVGIYNVKSYGAVGDDSTDDLDAIQDAIDAIYAAGGGWLYFPPGTYRVSAAIVCKPWVNLIGAPGATLSINHATAHLLSFSFASSSTLINVRGLSLQAAVANTGRMVHNDSATDMRVVFERCTIGANSNAQGTLVRVEGESGFTFRDCIVQVRGATVYGLRLSNAAGVMIVESSAVSMPATFSQALVYIESGRGIINGNVFDCSGHTTNSATCVGTSYRMTVTGNTFVGTGANEKAIGWDAGAMVVESGNEFASMSAYSVPGPPTILGNGSRLGLVPNITLASASTTPTLPDGYESVAFYGTGAVTLITMPEKLFRGQTLKLTVQNASGGNWAGPTLSEGGGVGGLNNGLCKSATFEVVDRNNAGSYEWVRIGDWSTAF